MKRIQTSDESKKSWTTPGLTRYGSVEELTLSKCKKSGTSDDFGNGMSTCI